MPPSSASPRTPRIGASPPTRSPTGIRAQPAARSSDRDYSTHVFTPDDVGFVHLEFQVSHHVREGDFVITALFSWESHVP